MSLNEARRLRAEVEERTKGPITADTLEWLLMRLARTGPQGAKWIQYAEPQWKEPLARVRIKKPGPPSTDSGDTNR